ncbi:hypothetical protein ABVK25_001430 [Lepraria finkii]|uniref:Uncharacterized protein n=1 Tax=Lepraria finkii TaxID=1340010 RepID=A0ABR4BLN5_9LECA
MACRIQRELELAVFGIGGWRARRSRLVQLGVTQQWRRVSAEIVAIAEQELQARLGITSPLVKGRNVACAEPLRQEHGQYSNSLSQEPELYLCCLWCCRHWRQG